jgi:hypothetical protein
MINMKPQVLTALKTDSQLISLLGGIVTIKNKTYQRIYQIKAPFAEEFPRITFFEYDNVPSGFADDNEIDCEVFIQIDVWCKGTSTSDIAKEVDIVMKSIGFQRIGAQDLYEDDIDTQIFHKAMRYSISVS